MAETEQYDALIRRLTELEGLMVRVHYQGKPRVTYADGRCCGLQDDTLLLEPPPPGPVLRIPLAAITTVTQLPTPSFDTTSADMADNDLKKRP